LTSCIEYGNTTALTRSEKIGLTVSRKPSNGAGEEIRTLDIDLGKVRIEHAFKGNSAHNPEKVEIFAEKVLILLPL